jgi:hypothetical protein
MNRVLMVLVLLEGVAIALLVFALITQHRPDTTLNPGPGQEARSAGAPGLQPPVDAGEGAPSSPSDRLGPGKEGGLESVPTLATDAPPARDFPPTSDSGHFNLGLGRFTPVQTFARVSDALPKEYVGILELGVRLPVSVSLLLRHVVLLS